MKGLCVRGNWRLNRTATYWPPHSYGHNSVSFPFSWAAQPGAQPLWTCSSIQHLLSNSTDWLPVFTWVHIIVRRPPSSCGHYKSHSFNLSTVKVIFWYSSTGCTCYLHRCISYFDSLPGVNVTIGHYLWVK